MLTCTKFPEVPHPSFANIIKISIYELCKSTLNKKFDSKPHEFLLRVAGSQVAMSKSQS